MQQLDPNCQQDPRPFLNQTPKKLWVASQSGPVPNIWVAKTISASPNWRSQISTTGNSNLPRRRTQEDLCKGTMELCAGVWTVRRVGFRRTLLDHSCGHDRRKASRDHHASRAWPLIVCGQAEKLVTLSPTTSFLARTQMDALAFHPFFSISIKPELQHCFWRKLDMLVGDERRTSEVVQPAVKIRWAFRCDHPLFPSSYFKKIWQYLQISFSNAGWRWESTGWSSTS